MNRNESLCTDGLDDDRDGATDCADSNCWPSCYTPVATGPGYRVYRVPFADCSRLAGWHDAIAYSDVDEGGWWTGIPEDPLGSALARVTLSGGWSKPATDFDH